MRLSLFFRLKRIVRWVSTIDVRKFRIPYIPYRSLLLSTIVLNDILRKMSFQELHTSLDSTVYVESFAVKAYQTYSR